VFTSRPACASAHTSGQCCACGVGCRRGGCDRLGGGCCHCHQGGAAGGLVTGKAGGALDETKLRRRRPSVLFPLDGLNDALALGAALGVHAVGDCAEVGDCAAKCEGGNAAVFHVLGLLGAGLRRCGGKGCLDINSHDLTGSATLGRVESAGVDVVHLPIRFPVWMLADGGSQYVALGD
jgi:hypothetical protein